MYYIYLSCRVYKLYIEVKRLRYYAAYTTYTHKQNEKKNANYYFHLYF